MPDTETDFSDQYRVALTSHIADGGEHSLNAAYELGRKALESGFGLLDLANLHNTALTRLLQRQTEDGDGSDRLVDHVNSASQFLEETFSPFEVSRLGSQGANAALRKLYDMLEEESKRIAHLLHDESAQLLAVIYMEVADIGRDAPEAIQSRTEQVCRHLDEIREQLRNLSHELRPMILDQLGLMPALRFLANGFHNRSNLEVQVDGDTDGRLSQPVETVLYRAVQEALSNIARHAQAKRVRIEVWSEGGQIHCLVSDDGVGFEIPEGRGQVSEGLGLVGIRERVNALDGNSQITSQPGHGTQLQVSIPI
ncbi:MAG: ATP-binding protein [Pseudohongiellaceae bacterium]